MKVTTVFILREDRQHNLAVIFLPVGILACLLSFPLCPAAAEEQPEPTLSSLFPLGGQRGTTIQVQFRGKHLHEVNSLWVRSDGFQARIKSVEPVDEAAVHSTRDDGSLAVSLTSTSPKRYEMDNMYPKYICKHIWGF